MLLEEVTDIGLAFSTHLIIEQVLMRSVKTTGSLNCGRGMTENQRLVWLVSLPSCAEVNN